MKKAKPKRAGVILTSVLLSLGPVGPIGMPLFFFSARAVHVAAPPPAVPAPPVIVVPVAVPAQQGK